MKPDNRLFFKQVEAILAEGREVEIRIRGNSMRPLLRDGCDTVVLAPCPDSSALRRGDIVLFRFKGRHILHRIVRIEESDSSTLRFTLAGDGNYRLREVCTEADVAARAVRVIRASGHAVECRSRRWRWLSHCWLSLPQIVRRAMLGMASRCKIK